MFDKTILPPNSTPLEIALDRLAAEKLDSIPIVISTLWNPAACPAHLLGWLAWGLSLDVWDSDWDEATKRKALAQSVALHRKKGTVGAVKDALALLGFRIDISEWFEFDGDPHTFRLDAFADDIFAAGFQIDPALLDRVRAVIETVKPVRSHLERLRIGERFGADIYLRSHLRGQQVDRNARDPEPRTNHAMSGQYLRAHLRTSQSFSASHDPVPRSNHALNTVALRSRMTAKAVHHYFHDVEERLA